MSTATATATATDNEVTEIVTVNNRPARFNAQDCKRVSAENKILYSADRIAQAEALFELVKTAYFRSRRVFLNYRKKFVAIKVSNPSRLDAFNMEDQKELQKFCDSHFVTIVKNNKSIIYRLK